MRVLKAPDAELLAAVVAKLETQSCMSNRCEHKVTPRPKPLTTLGHALLTGLAENA